jgi:hypothetical protein
LADFGHFGQGRKEIVSVRDLAWRGKDGLYVFDRQRALLFTSSGESRRVVPLPVSLVNYGLITPNGDFILSTPSYGGNNATLVNRYSRSGKLVKSYATESITASNLSEEAWRFISMAGTRAFFVHADSSYDFRVVDAETGTAKSFVRQAEWFPPRPNTVNRLPPTLEKPQTRFVGIRQDTTGHAWTFVVTAREGWKPQRPITDADRKKEHFILVKDVSDNLDTIIELVDLRAGRVIARRRLSGVIAPIHEPGWVVQADETADGVASLTLFRLPIVEH